MLKLNVKFMFLANCQIWIPSVWLWCNCVDQDSATETRLHKISMTISSVLHFTYHLAQFCTAAVLDIFKLWDLIESMHELKEQ